MSVAAPNALGDHAATVEDFYRAVADTNEPLDMSAIRFVRPYGVIALVNVARAHQAQTGEPLTLTRVPSRVHQYLERVDLFRVMGDLVRVDTPLTERFDRVQVAPKLLELSPVRDTADMLAVITRAEAIFAYWLPRAHLNGLMHILSELCANIYQHSNDPRGVVLVQTHEAVSKGAVRVRVALADAGVGVRANLRACCGEQGEAPLPYLLQALTGVTSRDSGRGGLGLRTVQRVVRESDGYIWLRSETAAVHIDAAGNRHTYDGLPYVRGTQLAVELHAPLPTR